MISEAGYEEGKGISYAKFMGQWNDDKEEFVREWRKHMLGDDGSSSERPHFVSDNQDLVSELSFDGSEGDPGRADFMERKSVSERKMAGLAVSERKMAVSERKMASLAAA